MKIETFPEISFSVSFTCNLSQKDIIFARLGRLIEWCKLLSPSVIYRFKFSKTAIFTFSDLL